MKSKQVQLLPLLVVLFMVGFSRFSLWCTTTGGPCSDGWLDHVFIGLINPLYFFALCLIPLTILLVFVRREAFTAWLKFALWAIPLTGVFVASVRVSSGSFFEAFPFYRDDAARLAAIVFSLVSLCVIGWKYLRLKRKGS